MLTDLHLEHFLFIEKARLDFSHGLNVITGETGAGKSILLEAIKLLMGKKAKSGIVLPQKRQATIQATFSIAAIPQIQQFLGDSGLCNEDDPSCLIISRTFRQDGGGKVFVNGLLSTTSFLRQLGPLLMEIHGQNEHQTLLQPDTQRRLLDRMGGLVHRRTLDDLKTSFYTCQKLKKSYENFCDKISLGKEKIQELQETVQDLASLNLTDQEEENSILAEVKLLANAEAIAQALDLAGTLLSGTDDHPGGVALVYQSKEALRQELEHDSRLEEPFAKLDSLYHDLVDVESQILSLSENSDFDPARLFPLQARLADFSRACRRYKCNFQELFQLYEDANNELETLYQPDSAGKRLQEELERQEVLLSGLCGNVSKQRQKLANSLEKLVRQAMEKLGFNQSKFLVELRPVPNTAHGCEQIEFTVALNPGVPAGPLRKIASGGELSRVALAIKQTLAEQDSLPTLLFDEIDSGIGGNTAEAVAQGLAKLSEQKQVILVTHLHQIAKEGEKHFVVEKFLKENETQVHIRDLNPREREIEIARMLGHNSTEGKHFARALLQGSENL